MNQAAGRNEGGNPAHSQFELKGRTKMRTVSLEEVIARESPEIQKEVEEGAAELAVELATLREIRKRQNITQVALAEDLGIGQEGVSRLERRNDTLVSTLRKTIEAMGGDLHLVAKFPDRRPVELSGFGES